MINLQDTYNQALKVYLNVVEDIRFGRQLYLVPVEICSGQICRFQDECNDILTMLINVQDKNPYMYAHPVNVAFLSLVIGKWLGLSDSMLKDLVCASLMHDIGKSKIKDSLLNKSEALTLEEAERMKTHPVIGYKILNNINAFNPRVLKGILFHHERMNGTGYPLHVKGDMINIISRIIAIADTYDAITSTKAYSAKKTPLEAIEEIKESNPELLDSYICSLFVSKMSEYFVGREVLLNNEQVGIIITINPDDLSKPVIGIEDKQYNLSEKEELEVIEIH